MTRTLTCRPVTRIRFAEVNTIDFFFSSRRRHTRWPRDWSSYVCSSDLGGGGPTVSELDTVTKCLELPGRRHPRDDDLVLLVDLVPRMHQPVGEVAVVGEDQESRAVGIQPPDRKEPVAVPALLADDVEDGRARGLVLRGRDDAERFVQHHVAMRSRRPDGPAVNGDAILLWIDDGTGSRRPLTVDANGPGSD